MTSPSAGGLRALRAAALATVTVSLALAAHTSAGGRTPGGLALATAVVGVGCAALLVTGRRLGRTATMAGLVVAQALLHAWFSLASGQACAVAGAFRHLHGAGADCLAAPAAVAAAHPSSSPSLVMTLAHLGAVLATGLLLAHGEALLWTLAGAVLARRPGALRPVVVPVTAGSPVGPTSAPATWTAPRARHLRGPPRACLAA